MKDKGGNAFGKEMFCNIVAFSLHGDELIAAAGNNENGGVRRLGAIWEVDGEVGHVTFGRCSGVGNSVFIEGEDFLSFDGYLVKEEEYKCWKNDPIVHGISLWCVNCHNKVVIIFSSEDSKIYIFNKYECSSG